VAGAAFTYADSLIDGYVGATYTLPLPSTPPLLVDLACDIVRYRLQGDQVPDQVRARYDDAIKLLRQIRAGDLKLEVNGDDEIESALVLTSGPDRRFTRDGMRGL